MPVSHLLRPANTPAIDPGRCPASPTAGANTFIYLSLSAPFTSAAYNMNNTSPQRTEERVLTSAERPATYEAPGVLFQVMLDLLGTK